MTAPLLDSNVLIALTVREHEHHGRASAWFATQERFAVCAVVEGALVRFLVRLGESAETAQALISGVHDLPACDFWADAPSYADADLSRVRGHRHVTDAYLVGLARSRSSVLATLDDALAREFSGATLLIPASEPTA